MAAITIRELTAPDVDCVLEIQRAAPEMAQWAAADYEKLAREPGGLVLVAESKEPNSSAALAGLAGFVAARAMGPEAELQNLAVRRELRRRGVALRLVEELHRRVAEAGVERVTLEVRASNDAARSLYRNCGYTECGLRQDYYFSDAGGYEDALIFQLKLRPTP